MLYTREEQAIWRFFHSDSVRITPLTRSQEYFWERLKKIDRFWDIHFLPPVALRPELYPAGAVKPRPKVLSGKQFGIDFFRDAGEGLIGDIDQQGEFLSRDRDDVLALPGRWVAVDGRPVPAYLDGEQRYEEDVVLGGVLKESRAQKKIGAVPSPASQTSRFFVSWEEWDAVIRGALASRLGVDAAMLRLPRVVEWNYLGNAFYPQWGETVDCEWLQDAYKERERGMWCGVGGGHFQLGGLSYVAASSIRYKWNNLAFRPLILL